MTAKEMEEMSAAWQDFRKRVARRRLGRIMGYSLLVVMLTGISASLMFNNEQVIPGADMKILAEAESVLLDDGTKVTLASGSRIEYPETFDSDVRRVAMEGSAYFEVKSSPDYPFIIDAAGGYVKVTGTKFNLSVISENHIKVSLDEGRIELGSAGHDPVLVYPSEEVEYDTAAGEVIQTTLMFMDDRLETVLEEVGAIYGFSAVFENESLKDVRLLFRVPKYDDAAKVLSLIETVCKIRIHYSDGVVRVSEQ